MSNSARIISCPIPKIIALVIVTLVLAAIYIRFDAHTLKMVDTMTPADYIQHLRKIHHHSYLIHFSALLVLGGIYLCAVELVAHLVRLAMTRTKTDAHAGE